MDNYEAIKEMDMAQLERFLDEVYLTGLNTGLYTAHLNEDERDTLLDNNPFSCDWLSQVVEEATLCAVADDGDSR